MAYATKSDHKLKKNQIVWNMIGAAPSVPSWSTGFQNGNDMGGLIAAVLAPAGVFGKFLLVLMAVSTSSSCAPTIYSFGEWALQEWSLSNLFLISFFFNHHFQNSMVVLSLLSYRQLFYDHNPVFRSSASICLYSYVHSHVSEYFFVEPREW